METLLLGLTTASELEAGAGKSQESRQGRQLEVKRKVQQGIQRTWHGDPPHHAWHSTKHSVVRSAAACLPSCEQRHDHTHQFHCGVAMSELLNVWRLFRYMVQVIT